MGLVMPPSSTVGVFDPYASRFAPWATYITSVARTTTFPAVFKSAEAQTQTPRRSWQPLSLPKQGTGQLTPATQGFP